MTETIRSAFDRLAADLRNVVQDRPIVFLLSPGNWGDSIIREGAERFFQHYGFKYHTVIVKEVMKKRTTMEAEIAKTGHPAPVVVCNGNGAFCRHYDTPQITAQLTRHFQTAVMLPSTVDMDLGQLTFAPEMHFFVRDRFESQARLPDVPFCHDMAFFLKLSAPEPRKEVGYFLRQDREAPNGLVVPRGNYDVSKKGRIYTPIQGFVDAISPFKTVHTNRLHVGIVATLLGRETHIYPNDYFKIRAIFDSSISPFFPNATFGTTFVPPKTPKRLFGLF